MSGDLVGGSYPLTYPFRKGLGLPANATQGNISPRSNLELPFLGNLADQAAALVSGVITLVAIPVEIGDEITKVSVLVGATAAATPTHQWAALYSGALTTAALQGAQSADGTSTAISASGRLDFALATSVLVTATNAPYGYVYAAISVTAGTVPSLISATCAAAGQYAWYADTPLFAATTGSAVGGAAPATLTLASGTASAKVPAVFLS